MVFFGAHTFGHSVFTVRKIFIKVFTTLFFDILYLTSANRHNPAKDCSHIMSATFQDFLPPSPPCQTMSARGTPGLTDVRFHYPLPPSIKES